MPKDESAWNLRASTPFIYESEENVAQKFIHGGRSRVPKSAPKTPMSTKSFKNTDNKSSLKSQTFAPVDKKNKVSQTPATLKSRTCYFEAEMAASPVAISHKYYEYITDANAKYNVNGMGVFRKFKPDVPTITCKPQVFDWNLNLQQNILHKPKDSSSDLRYNGGKSKLISPPPPPTPIPQTSRKGSKHLSRYSQDSGSVRTGYVNKLDNNLSPATLGLIRKIIRDCSRTKIRGSSLYSDSDSSLDNNYANKPSSSRIKPKHMRRVPKPQTDDSKETKCSSTKRHKFVIRVSSNNKVQRVPISKEGSAPLKNKSTSQRIAKKLKVKKTSVAKKRSTKDVKKEEQENKND